MFGVRYQISHELISWRSRKWTELKQCEEILFNLRLKVVFTDSVTSHIPAFYIRNSFPSLGTNKESNGRVILPQAKEKLPNLS